MALLRKAKLDSLSPEDIDALAFDKLLASVSASEQSTAKINKKLKASGIPDASVEKAISKAVRIGVIDDARYSECLIRSAMATGKGISFVRDEIEQLGIDIESLDAYQEYQELGDEWQIEQALDFLKHHPPRCKDVYSGCLRKLISRGFSHDIALSAAKSYIQNA